jgi:hypothetical protein
MEAIHNLEGMDALDVLNFMNTHWRDPDTIPADVARTAAQVKVITALTKSIEEFRRSSERASKAIICLTLVLAGTAVVQVILAFCK